MTFSDSWELLAGRVPLLPYAFTYYLSGTDVDHDANQVLEFQDCD